MLEILLTIFTIALVFLAIPVAIQAVLWIIDRHRSNGNEGEQPMSAPRNPGRWSFISFNFIGIAVIIVAGLVITQQWKIQSRNGFNPPWPDAIQCQIIMPDQRGTSYHNYNYIGITTGRQPFGDVARYSLTGVYNLTVDQLHRSYPGIPDDLAGYIPHEVWFYADPKQSEVYMSMIDPRKFNLRDLDSPVSQHYYMGWLDPSCGGSTIKDIIKSGNGFSFATQMN